jgi:neutral ceramidase
MIPANIYYASDILIDANINRSPASYLNNPSWERAK